MYSNKQADLLKLHFIKVNKDHPEFKTKYDGVATNLDVAVSTINLMVTRKTLLTLLDFVMITFTGGDDQQQPKNEQKKVTDGEKPKV